METAVAVEPFLNSISLIEMFCLNSTLNFGIPPVLVFQVEVYYNCLLLTGIPILAVFQNLRWNSNKTSLHKFQNYTI